MSESSVVKFTEDLHDLIVKYQFDLNVTELCGILKIMSDDVSEKMRNKKLQGPNEFS